MVFPIQLDKYLCLCVISLLVLTIFILSLFRYTMTRVIALDVANRLEASVHVLENEWRRIGDGYIIDAADDKGRDKNVGKCFTEMKQMVHVLRGTVDIREVYIYSNDPTPDV